MIIQGPDWLEDPEGDDDESSPFGFNDPDESSVYTSGPTGAEEGC